MVNRRSRPAQRPKKPENAPFGVFFHPILNLKKSCSLGLLTALQQKNKLCMEHEWHGFLLTTAS